MTVSTHVSAGSGVEAEEDVCTDLFTILHVLERCGHLVPHARGESRTKVLRVPRNMNVVAVVVVAAADLFTTL